VHYKTGPDIGAWQHIFDSGGLWRLWQKGQQWAISLYSDVFDPRTYQLAIFDHIFSQGDIYIPPALAGKLSFRFDQVLAEALMVNLLAQGRGVLLHACGIIDGDKGRLLTGNSGDGKSTSARIWQEQPNICIISDDRVIVRQHEGRLWMYGTPWHGDAGLASRQAAPIDQIFFLKHDQQNRATPLHPSDATARMLVRSFPTFWNAQGMDFTLSFLSDLSQAAPCYELGFRPDTEIVDFVRSL